MSKELYNGRSPIDVIQETIAASATLEHVLVKGERLDGAEHNRRVKEIVLRRKKTGKFQTGYTLQEVEAMLNKNLVL